MSKNKICIACGFEDFEENINNFCCNCGKDIDTGLTLEEMDKQGINYLIDKRTNEYRNDITEHNDLVEFRNKLTNDTDCVILEEDCQLLDRVLDDLEQKDHRIAELKAKLEKMEEVKGESDE